MEKRVNLDKIWILLLELRTVPCLGNLVVGPSGFHLKIADIMG